MRKSLLIAALLALTACGGNQNKGTQAADPSEANTPSAEQFAKMQELYENADDDHGWMPLCKWQYVDLDGDGIDEVWMRDKDDEYGAMFSLADGTVSLIGIETDRFPAFTREQKDGKGYFCKAGAAGGPSYYTEIITVKDSRVAERFNLLEVYGEVDGAGLNGKDIGAEEARAYTAALPESKELVPGEWNILDLTEYDRVPDLDNSAQDPK